MKLTKRVLVVGGDGGVGGATVGKLLAEGFTVIASALNEAGVRAVTEANSGIERAFVLDLADADAIAQTLALELGDQPLDAVVCCAGISLYGPIETTPLQTLRKLLEINAVANVALFQTTVRQIHKSQGRYIFLSSIIGRVSLPLVGYYSASKHTLEALADAMRREVYNFGVRVSLIEPGGIQTPMVESQIASLREDRASLTGVNAEYYSHLFETHEKSANAIKADGIAPVKVAEVVLEALTAAEPRARYVVGDDAIYLDGLIRAGSEETLDQLAGITTSTPQ
jgi:NAD(P)-dependent dehydrogenase (short-subunit alcohol dehydrogenase family)